MKESSKKSKKEEKIKMGSQDAESIKTTKSALSLFRTPSLPKRLKFKHISDLTPKKSKEGKEAAIEKVRQLDLEAERGVDCPSATSKLPPIVQLYNKIDSNKEALQRAREENEELKARVQELLAEKRQAEADRERILGEKDNQVMLLERELTSISKADELLQGIAEGCLEKVKENEREIRGLHGDYERKLMEVHEAKFELEMRYEELEIRYSALQEDYLVSEGENYLMGEELTMVREILEAHDMELQRKVDDIKEMERLLGDLMKEGKELKEQVNYFKQQAEEDMMRYVEESRTTIRDIDTLKKENERLLAQLVEKNVVIEGMQEELNENQFEMDEIRDEIRTEFNQELRTVLNKYEQQIATLNEVNEMKIRDALAAEKMRWQKELDKCQKIAETEIMQCEFEKRDLRTLWEASNEVIKEHENKINELERRLRAEMGGSNKTKEEYECELKEATKENTRLQTEKYNYQLTLNNTRSTVNILMERLKKSDGDVEMLKSELDSLLKGKTEMETENNKLREEIEEYRRVLTALRLSSTQMEKEMRDKEEVFEKIMTSEEDAIMTVSQMGKLFNEKMEESISRYLEMYDDLKKKYDAREAYIQDMKTLLDEFATGIELARIELDTKDKKISELENENKDIKLENMTFRFKCEQFEKYLSESRLPQPSPEPPTKEDEELVSNLLIESLINQLEKDEDGGKLHNSEHIEVFKDVIDKETTNELNEQLKATENKLRLVEQFAKETSDKYTELLENQNNRQKSKNAESNKDNQQLKAKIAKQQEIIKKHESTIHGLQQQLSCFDSPQKQLNVSGLYAIAGSPKTPKKQLLGSPFPGKENRSPAVYSPRAANALRPRNN
ncbi:miranda [Culex quinquefasciatus]|uniref:Miranda n=1 Tax=Culex quinquefasciatus TaxID=7176 RepID=B0XHF0_CULQU|nr:miranda [Culex quinquefasciatus]|eukprot:XP_001869072.1 miranda [Culex quinquefasciatus]